MKLKLTDSNYSVWLLGIVGLLLVFLSVGLSISYGATSIHIKEIWQALFMNDLENQATQVVREIRLPRTIVAGLVGAFLGVAGALMQGMTRNPLASPSILGVSDGAAFMLVIVMAFVPHLSHLGTTFAALFGAGVAVTIIFMIGSMAHGGMTSVKLVLAGVAIGTLLRSLSTIFALHFQLEKDIGFWLAGGLNQVGWQDVQFLVVIGFSGMLLALSLAKSMTILNLGDDLATGLGQNNFIIRVFGIIAVLLLTGVSVSVAGVIGFLGLIVPHIVRFVIGTNYQKIIPLSAILGALLLINADILARLINAPFETPVGAITSVIGVPFFLYLARKSGGSKG